MKISHLLSWNICSIPESSKVYVGFTISVIRSVVLVPTSTTIYQWNRRVFFIFFCLWALLSSFLNHKWGGVWTELQDSHGCQCLRDEEKWWSLQAKWKLKHCTTTLTLSSVMNWRHLVLETMWACRAFSVENTFDNKIIVGMGQISMLVCVCVHVYIKQLNLFAFILLVIFFFKA